MIVADFQSRISELSELVGGGDLVGKVVVDQVYAKYQHERLDLKHPSGGQVKYLEDPLYAKADSYLSDIADVVLEGGAANAMTQAMEDLAGAVEKAAPVDLGNLRESGAPSVTDDGSVHYDRPPVQRRLTEAELRQMKSRYS